MSLCRICLCSKPRKQLTELSHIKREEKRSTHNTSKGIILFCLAIEISEDSLLNTKLCVKCYKKIICFYEFKTLALENDVYWRSLNLSEPKNFVFLDEINIKKEECTIGYENNEDALFDHSESEEHDIIEADAALKEVKVELKQEDQSDDELLSVIQKAKHLAEECKENAPIKKKRGRPKQLKIHGVITESKICEECGLAVKNLKLHLLRHIPTELRKKVKCELCDKVFSTHTLKRKHIKRKHFGIKNQCHLCEKSVSNLKLHIQLIHNPDSLRYQCGSCGRRFHNQSRLDSHASVHTKDRPFECDICGNKFRIKLSLDMHKRQVHDKERSHLCQFCSKSFFKKHHLNIHLRSHTQERPYPCPDCGKHYQTSTSLKNHRLTHSTEKKYFCSLCTMRFTTPNYLRSHMASHSKVKRYPCQFCGLAFHRSDHRKRHEFTAHLRHATGAVATLPELKPN